MGADPATQAALDQLSAEHRELAMEHRAIYEGYLSVGFTPAQALELTIARIGEG